jgi:hypothetical protein
MRTSRQTALKILAAKTSHESTRTAHFIDWVGANPGLDGVRSMTITEQVALASDKVAHWNSKREHALAMLTKWQARLSALQSKGKPQPTAKSLPAVTLVADVAKETNGKVVPMTKGKTPKGKPPTKKN